LTAAAVGLRFTGDPLPGLIPEAADNDLPEVVVELDDEGELDDRWAAAAAPELIFERPFRDGRPFLRVERDTAVGYRVWALDHGTHLIPPDASRCASAPSDVEARALRLLAAQTIPLLATLRGREVLHAAGIVVDGRMIGIVASAGTGKSTTACNVIAQGGEFFADDVLALEVADGEVRAHPGTRLLNIFEHEYEAISEPGRTRLGVPIGRTDKVHLSPPGYPRSLPLSGLLFLDRSTGAAATALHQLDNAASRLLGNAFLPYLDRAERLSRQLEVMSTLSQTVPLARLEVGNRDTPATLAGTVREWVQGLP